MIVRAIPCVSCGVGRSTSNLCSVGLKKGSDKLLCSGIRRNRGGKSGSIGT